MRKFAAVSLLVVLLAGAVWLIYGHSSKTKPTGSHVTSKVSYKKACDIFSLKDAVTILGEGTAQVPSHTDNINSQKAVTTCLYSYDPGILSEVVTASLLLQGSTAGQAKSDFAAARLSSAQPLTGYGEAAYWNPDLGQLNIQKGSYWVTISAGSGPLSGRTPDLARKIADIIVKRL